jgi:putative sugar O-methyltransferase
LPRYLGAAEKLLRDAGLDRRMGAIEAQIHQQHFDEAARMYRDLIGRQPTLSTVYEAGMRLAKSGELGDAFTRAAINAVHTPELRAMMLFLMKSPAIFQPSRLWLYFMFYNAFQLETAGVDVFKKTVNHNYFNWTADSDIQLQSQSLQTTLGLSDADVDALERDIDAPQALKPVEFSAVKWRLFSRLVALLYEYARRDDRLGLLDRCEEPALGTPLYIRYKGRSITQDLCNSIVDVNTFLASPVAQGEHLHVAELGAGHGRIQNILLRARPGFRVTIIDIPPALYVSQWYLSRLFPERRVFAFRDFKDFNDVKAEFDAADLIFLSPAQVELLPPKIFDGFLNICSLQEMKPEQIQNWFRHIDRLCRGWFFTKQYKESVNPFDGVVVRKTDYPVPSNWSTVFDRDNPGNTSLFEAMYKL